MKVLIVVLVTDPSDVIDRLFSDVLQLPDNQRILKYHLKNWTNKPWDESRGDLIIRICVLNMKSHEKSHKMWAKYFKYLTLEYIDIKVKI